MQFQQRTLDWTILAPSAVWKNLTWQSRELSVYPYFSLSKWGWEEKKYFENKHLTYYNTKIFNRYSHTGSRVGTICLLRVHLSKDLFYGNKYAIYISVKLLWFKLAKHKWTSRVTSISSKKGSRERGKQVYGKRGNENEWQRLTTENLKYRRTHGK